MSKLDSILTLMFYVLAIATVVLYFALPTHRLVFMICGFTAIALRVIQYIIRNFS